MYKKMTSIILAFSVATIPMTTFAEVNSFNNNESNFIVEPNVEIDGDRYIICEQKTQSHYITWLEANRGTGITLMLDGMLYGLGITVPFAVAFSYGAVNGIMLSSPQENDLAIQKGFVTYDKKNDSFSITVTFENYRNGMRVYQQTDNTVINRYDYQGAQYEYLMNKYAHRLGRF